MRVVGEREEWWFLCIWEQPVSTTQRPSACTSDLEELFGYWKWNNVTSLLQVSLYSLLSCPKNPVFKIIMWLFFYFSSVFNFCFYFLVYCSPVAARFYHVLTVLLGFSQPTQRRAIQGLGNSKKVNICCRFLLESLRITIVRKMQKE